VTSIGRTKMRAKQGLRGSDDFKETIPLLLYNAMGWYNK